MTVPVWFPRSTFGLVLASIYVVVAVTVVVGERTSRGGGGWISLKGMGSYLITFPISFIGEALGVRPDYRRTVDIAFAIGACAMVIYYVAVGLAHLARTLFSDGAAG